MPKGVKLVHGKLIQVATCVNYHFRPTDVLCERDCYISYLPAAHSFEQALFATASLTGMKVGFYSGDPAKMVSDDLPVLKPTIFPSVPRLYNKIYSKIKDNVGALTGCAAYLANNGINTKL